jgi:hypothetical protein
MQKMRLWSVALLAAAILASLGLSSREDKPKYTIKQIMKKVHAGKVKLQTKLEKGTATDEEKVTIVEYYEELPKNKPPKGDAKGWEERTNALLAAAKEATKGGEEERAKYKKAVNCKACHDVHQIEE